MGLWVAQELSLGMGQPVVSRGQLACTAVAARLAELDSAAVDTPAPKCRASSGFCIAESGDGKHEAVQVWKEDMEPVSNMHASVLLKKKATKKKRKDKTSVEKDAKKELRKAKKK